MTATQKPLKALREQTIEEFVFHLEKARESLSLSTTATGLYLLAGLKALDEVFVTLEEMDLLADYNRHAIFELQVAELIKPTYVYSQDETGEDYPEPAYYLPLVNHPDDLPTIEEVAQAQWADRAEAREKAQQEPAPAA